jgi:hypothetical protein
MSDAIREVDLKCTRSIKKVVEGKLKTAGGFIWKYATIDKN